VLGHPITKILPTKALHGAGQQPMSVTNILPHCSIPSKYNQGLSILPKAQLHSQLGVPPSCSTVYPLVGFVKTGGVVSTPTTADKALHEIKGWTLSTMQY